MFLITWEIILGVDGMPKVQIKKDESITIIGYKI
jgi:hypothetical protein